MARFGSAAFWRLFHEVAYGTNPNASVDRWRVEDVEWIRERHAFWGRDYSIQMTVHTLVCSGRRPWKLLAVVESWWGEDRSKAIKSQEWCRPARGQPNDVAGWFAAQASRVYSDTAM
jgi:hypothetical protein